MLALALIAGGCGETDEDAETTTGGVDVKLPNPFSGTGSDTGDDHGEGEDGPGNDDRAGGEACCKTDDDCADDLLCMFGQAADEGECVEQPEEGQCYKDADCAEGTCENVIVCGCTTCDYKSEPGTCATESDPADACCKEDDDCTGALVCLQVDGKGACNLAAGEGKCWTDDDCEAEQECVGAAPRCECGVPCGAGHNPGDCAAKFVNPCSKDADCGEGASCMAGGVCTDDCLPGDASCCDHNTCVDQINECTAHDQCADGLCVQGSLCYDFCADDDLTCCFGNACWVDNCTEPPEVGCVFTGCPKGQACVVTEEVCLPSACECSQDVGWSCSDDCAGGQCVASACPGNNPQGCTKGSCPAGQKCVVSPDTCVPTGCTCDETAKAWACTPDCGGGVCL